ncbi:MAG: orotidine-5'-phosphate decarboxylase [Solirubrobacteraceae bacterium]
MAPGFFGDRLAGRVNDRASQLVVGLDPDPMSLWPRAYDLAERQGPGKAQSSPSARAAFAVAVHCVLVIEAIADHAVAVKLQVACFERLGAPGWAALVQTVQRARERGLLVLADAKRGDIDVTAAAYAQAYFGATPTPYGEVAGIASDALTVNPLLGVDSLKPLVQSARERGAGLFGLVRTSNRGAADVQDRALEQGGTVSERLAEIVRELGREGVGSSGLSDVGAVVGATVPDLLARFRELMPDAVFLLPGVGAQGGRVEALAPALGEHPASVLISSSRGIVGASAVQGGDPAEGARREAARLQELAWNLGR